MTRYLHRFYILTAVLIALLSQSLLLKPAVGQVIGIESRYKAEGPITMEADRVTYDQKVGSITMEGAVRIQYKEASVQADKIIYYDQTKDVVAEGRVVFTEGEDILRCSRMELNIETKKGVVYDGNLFLKKKNFHITGKKAEKLGEAEYRVYDATLTSCDARVPYWKFTANRLDVDLNGNAQGWWPGFRVKEIPILYFPWSIFPVKRERQSGFLFPEFGSSSKWGPEITIPFYWAIAPNQDATFYFERIGDKRGRGFKEGIEYRYAWSTRAKGQITGFYIYDERLDKNRWSVFADHDQSFPHGYYIKADINWVSDKDYPVDFDGDLPGDARIDARSRNLIESTAMVGKNWEWGSLGIETTYFRDLTVDHNDATLQILPQTNFFLFQNRFLHTPLFYEMEVLGTNFWREEGFRGGRVELYPRVSIPLKPLDIVRFEPWIGYRETIYFNATDQFDDVTSREIFDAGVSLATTMSRVFPVGWKRIQKVKHIMEPGLIYSYIPTVNQSHNPHYKVVSRIPKGGKFGHVFDDRDTIPRENAITWMLTNYLIGKEINKDGDTTYPEYLYLKLYQSYDFSPDISSEQRISNLSAEARVALFTWLSGTIDLEYNPHHRRLDVLNAGAGLSDKRHDYLNVQYRRTREEGGGITNLEEINAELGIRIIDPLDFYFAYRHNLLDKTRIETVYGLDYRHQCWEIALRVHDINQIPEEDEGRELKVMIYLTLTGLGKYRIQ